MWSLTFPSEVKITAFLGKQKKLAYSYPEVGASRKDFPSGYNIDHNRVLLGRGKSVFSAGCQALRDWKMFPESWTKILPNAAPIQQGQIVAMVARAYGFWWLNSCRIVYTLEEDAPVRRYGFAYGTLPGHVERGEERFSIEWLADDTVWYDLRAFSQPRYWPVRLAKPLARGLQCRFIADSKIAMVRAVSGRT